MTQSLNRIPNEPQSGDRIFQVSLLHIIDRLYGEEQWRSSQTGVSQTHAPASCQLATLGNLFNLFGPQFLISKMRRISCHRIPVRTEWDHGIMPAQ
jgi:hypothetical protein